MCTYSWSLIWTLGIRIKSSCFPKAWALQKLGFLNNCIYLITIKKKRCLDVAWQFSVGWIYHWHLESNQVWLPKQDPSSMRYVNISPMKGSMNRAMNSSFPWTYARIWYLTLWRVFKHPLYQPLRLFSGRAFIVIHAVSRTL